MGQLDERVERLEGVVERLEAARLLAERQLRWWRLAALTGAAAVVALVGASPGDAQRGAAGEVAQVKAPFKVVDDGGRVLFQVTSSQDGPRVHVLNPSGKSGAIELTGTAEGGAIRLYSAQATELAWLRATQFGGDLALYDAAGVEVAWMRNAANARGLTLYDPAGKAIAGLGTTQLTRGLAIFDEAEHQVAGLMVGEGGGRLGLYDREGRPVLAQP
jgi:hypothetical protein